MHIKKVVDNPEWQSLRKSMVGTWKKTPRKNISRLKEYLGDWHDPLRCRRVHNYLTGSGFRIGVISHPDIDRLVRQLRKRDKSGGRHA